MGPERWDAPRPNVGTINDLSGMFGGIIVHGETTYQIDVEFRNIGYALTFISVVSDKTWNWPCELRDSFSAKDIEEMLTKPVTLIIDKDI